MDLVDGVLGVCGWQLLRGEHPVGGVDHALSVVVAQLHAGADDRAAKPLAQDLEEGWRTNVIKQTNTQSKCR